MKKQIVIIGGGACALMLGSELDPKKYNVAIYERNSALGRKFLVAGDGGLNLTHSESLESFEKRYTPNDFLLPALRHFSNRDLMSWFEKAGVPVYTGTSGRVFPEKKFKPIDVLNVFGNKLKANQVQLFFKHLWEGFGMSGDLVFTNDGKTVSIMPDLVIFCLGGASWPVTGSVGEWTEYFGSKKIGITSFYPSNCSYSVTWPKQLIDVLEGKALKNISISCGGHIHHGEVVITRFGLEGSGIYPLSPQIRKSLMKINKADIQIDFKPMVSEVTIKQKLQNAKGKKSYTEFVKESLHLTDTQIKLIKGYLSKEEFLDPEKLTFIIKRFPLVMDGTGPLDDAISSVGGINLDEINEHFELKKMPGIYCIGEMLNYDAPTGGYLLQSCFSMAKYLADKLNDASK